MNSFIGGSAKAEFSMVSSEKSTNMFTEQISPPGQSYAQYALRSLQGTLSMSEFPSLNGVGCRGLYCASTGPDSDPVLYGVFGSILYRIKNDYSYVKVTGISSSSTRISMCESGGPSSHLLLADGSTLYALPVKCTDAEIPSKITTIDLPTNPYNNDRVVHPDFVVYVKGYIIVNDNGTDQMFFTDPFVINGGTRDLYDYTVGADGAYTPVYEEDGITPKYITFSSYKSAFLTMFQQSQYFTAEASSDKITALLGNQTIMWSFGKNSIQAYQTQDDVDNPFTSVGLWSTSIGLKAPNSIAKMDNTVCFIGNGENGENIVYSGNSPSSLSRISDVFSETQMDGVYTEDAVGFAYSRNGHAFYVLTFPTADFTICYDFTTKKWHNRASRDEKLNINHYWWPCFACQAYGQTHFGTFDKSNLVVLKDNKYEEFDGRPIVKERIGPVVFNDSQSFIVEDIELLWNVGTSPVVSGQGANPSIMLSLSKDGGNTYGIERWAKGGVIGAYSYRTRWGQGGMTRLLVAKISCSDPVPLCITGLKMRVTPCKGF